MGLFKSGLSIQRNHLNTECEKRAGRKASYVLNIFDFETQRSFKGDAET
jgi:hypothetical protein